MSRTLTRYVDFGLLAALLLSLFTVWPLLQQPGLPNGTDTLYHIHRVAEMDRAWTHGVLMPRWAETFYFGYGSPVFHYYASMTYYVTSTLMRLFALNAVDSLRALTVLSMLLAGGGMYLFMRDNAGKLGGVIAAVVYVYSPYIVFTEPYTRGAYPELLALAFFPLVMWRYNRLLSTGGGVDFALAAVSSGILIITHNLMALVMTGLLAGWLLWRAVSLRHFVTSFAALLTGVGLAAYFWMPVMLEQDAVRLGNLTAVAQLDYRNFFVPLRDLLAFSPRPDAGAINGLLHQLNLGVAQWVLALAGGITALFNRRLFALYFALVALALIILMLPLAGFIWQAITPLAMLQFPWRFLGPAVFCLAVLAGMNALWLARLPHLSGGLLTALVIALPVALALPTLYIDEWENTSVDTSVAAYHESELSGLQRATTFSDEYLPGTVVVPPSANAALLSDFANGYPVDRANHDGLPDGVGLTLVEHGPQHDIWRVSAAENFTLEVLAYYFPGWQAEIDGEAVPVHPSEPHGMMIIDVPAGEHTIRLFLGQTPARWAGIAVTLVTAGVILAGAYLLYRPEAPVPVPPMAHPRGMIAGGLLALVLVGVFMREGLAWVNSPPGVALPAQHQTAYELGDQIQLLGYDLNGQTFNPGDRLELTLYWYGREAIDYGYAVFVHITDGGPPVAQADKQNPAGRPTLEWTPDGYIRDSYVINLPESIPPGEYQITVGMYTCDTRPPGECGNGDRLPVTSSDGHPLGDAAPLRQIVLR